MMNKLLLVRIPTSEALRTQWCTYQAQGLLALFTLSLTKVPCLEVLTPQHQIQSVQLDLCNCYSQPVSLHHGSCLAYQIHVFNFYQRAPLHLCNVKSSWDWLYIVAMAMHRAIFIIFSVCQTSSALLWSAAIRRHGQFCAVDNWKTSQHSGRIGQVPWWSTEEAGRYSK